MDEDRLTGRLAEWRIGRGGRMGWLVDGRNKAIVRAHV